MKTPLIKLNTELYGGSDIYLGLTSRKQFLNQKMKERIIICDV